MRVTVLGGSPKGETSVTMRYVRWLEKRFPGHDFEVVQAASRIAAYERDPRAFDEAMAAVGRAEIVLWAFPLYVFTVCSQYKRFIELVGERGAEAVFRGKYAASLSTSIHFFDHTAHDYVREVAEDLGMVFVASHSPGMDDLLGAEGRAALEDFAVELFDAAERRLPCPRLSAPLPVHEPLSPPPEARARSRCAGKTLVLVDYPDGAAGAMARRFAQAIEGEVEVLALRELGISGGCLGCLRCGQANLCAYEGKDGFTEAYRSRIARADILVYAGTTRDRGLSARWKAYLDRSFFNTHRRSLPGKQFVFLVSGPLSRLDNLRQTLAAYVEWQGSNLVAIVSDEAADAEALGEAIDAAASRAARAAASGIRRPATFLGVAGMKVFRDDIFGGLKVVFKADHRAYRREGIYDFPHRNPAKRLAAWLAYWVTSIPFVHRRMMADFPKFMLMPYRGLVESAKPREADAPTPGA